jgi:hypothetical protein
MKAGEMAEENNHRGGSLKGDVAFPEEQVWRVLGFHQREKRRMGGMEDVESHPMP